ncbi:MAG TPA: epoxyqueuosine reductase QueH [Mesotoga infera]|uniref:Epoxyqueuosine reductase QueH n=1 Tax=Mesotoga infera TaxID=1236046 RepID=A0A7C1CUQ2_9BACT|nr:epoxyqueuosine reductase QueH [Mesotoga infera]
MNLLHVCCAPDLVSAVVKRAELRKSELFFYNPNIFPVEEFLRRYDALRKVCAEMSLDLPEQYYFPEDFSDVLDSFGAEREGGMRCVKCIELRLRKTAILAKSIGASSFTTTLLASPMKSIAQVTLIGEKLAAEFDIEFVSGNFRADRDELRDLLKGVYRQNYCGCLPSRNEAIRKREITDSKDRERLEKDFKKFVDLWDFRGSVIPRSRIHLEEISDLKKLVAIVKPSALFDDIRDAELGDRRWLKTGSYNCRIIREKE